MGREQVALQSKWERRASDPRRKPSPPRGSARGRSSVARRSKSDEQRKASNLRLFHQELARLLNKQKDAPWSKYWATVSARGQQ